MYYSILCGLVVGFRAFCMRFNAQLSPEIQLLLQCLGMIIMCGVVGVWSFLKIQSVPVNFSFPVVSAGLLAGGSGVLIACFMFVAIAATSLSSAIIIVTMISLLSSFIIGFIFGDTIPPKEYIALALAIIATLLAN